MLVCLIWLKVFLTQLIKSFGNNKFCNVLRLKMVQLDDQNKTSGHHIVQCLLI